MFISRNQRLKLTESLVSSLAKIISRNHRQKSEACLWLPLHLSLQIVIEE